MEEVEKLCDRVYIMDHGQIIASGTQDEIKHIISNEETLLIEVMEHSEDFVTKLSEHPAVNNVIAANGGYKVTTAKGEDLFSFVFELAKESKVKISGVHVQTPTLEDVFLHLTGRKLRD